MKTLEQKQQQKVYSMKGIDFCRHCMITGVPMNKEVTCGERVYLTCRECNKLRMQKYYATQNGKESVRKAVNKSTKKFGYKQRAREILNYAVRSNQIVKPKICSMCKLKDRLEAHHSDYSKPLKVKWVCQSCHCILDRAAKKALN
jgi:hypothetical protein